jgi:hypothetical protein
MAVFKGSKKTLDAIKKTQSTISTLRAALRKKSNTPKFKAIKKGIASQTKLLAGLKNRKKLEILLDENKDLLASQLKIKGEDRKIANLVKDIKRKAKPRGKRVSESGNVYYNYQANRSDVIPRVKL